MLLRTTLEDVLRSPLVLPLIEPEVERELVRTVELTPSHATVLTGVRRSGKSTLQQQLAGRAGSYACCNFEDTRLFGFGPGDFATFLSLVCEMWSPEFPVFLDEVQNVPDWQRLVRALLDAGRTVCITGSNASLLGRELGAKLTGRHLSYEVFPFSYVEYCAFRSAAPGAESFISYLDEGGFPGYLRTRDDRVLQEFLRDVIQRDVATRHRLRETRHLMNLMLFILANTGRPFSFHHLTKRLDIPTVAQTARYMEFLQDAYLLFSVEKHSTSAAKRLTGAAKYYAIDNGMRKANARQLQPDVGHRLENAVALHLRRHRIPIQHLGEEASWECDFATPDALIQVCATLTPENRRRELKGLVKGSKLRGARRAVILTLDQTDRLIDEGLEVDVVPAWRWMSERRSSPSGSGTLGSREPRARPA